MPLSDGLLTMFEADAAESIARRRDDTQLAIARQRDGAAYDMRMLQGFISGTLFAQDDGNELSRINAAVRVPTTLDHPGGAPPASK